MDLTVPQLHDCLMSPNYSGLSELNCLCSESDCVWEPDSSFSDSSTPLRPAWVSPEFDHLMLTGQLQFPLESDCLTDSTSHSLSPISSVDSSRFSPSCFTVVSPGESTEAWSLPSQPTERPGSGQRLRKTRPRYPGRQRQSASEREKLRMRGLAKALHNLRTYLPPSVVPASQSLTKLETLRLTIRYISHLTELLRLSEESPSEGSDIEGRYPPDMCSCQPWLQRPFAPPSFTLPALPSCHQRELLTMSSQSHLTTSQVTQFFTKEGISVQEGGDLGGDLRAGEWGSRRGRVGLVKPGLT
ncbi:hypothetical protein chiPu_0020476 [Chiloscyllium punctatum]|uniref:BHLH domain-containing protein n=1 Tax=Chiloscyllium punctatum TaxID=137246 RepID=A0A401RG25_CHIPU|nr:hypothetical protein [Chiloscyllium punctatum]